MSRMPMPNEPLKKSELVRKPERKSGKGGAANRGTKLRPAGAAGWGSGLLLLLLLGSCSPDNGPPPAPDDLLAPAALVPVLADLHVAEARAQHSARAADTVQALYQQQEKAVFWRRNLSARQFQQSYAYYAARPAELEAIYAALTDTLAMRQVRLRGREEKKK